MNFCADADMNEVAFSNTILLSSPKQILSSSLINLITVSYVTLNVTLAIGQLIMCSTAIRSNFFPFRIGLKWPAKSI